MQRKREAKLEIKEESIKSKNELEKESRERRQELKAQERRLESKEEAVDRKLDALETREKQCQNREANLQRRETAVKELTAKRVQELERISGLTSDQAKEQLLQSVEEDVKLDMAKMIKEQETLAKEEADKKAKYDRFGHAGVDPNQYGGGGGDPCAGKPFRCRAYYR